MSVALTLTPLSAADAPFPEACAAFLSLTMYAPPEFSLVDGPTGRYSIGDRTPGAAGGRRRERHDRDAARRARPRRGADLAPGAHRSVPADHADVHVWHLLLDRTRGEDLDPMRGRVSDHGSAGPSALLRRRAPL